MKGPGEGSGRTSSTRLRPRDLPHPARVDLDARGRPLALHGDGGARRQVVAIRETWRIDDEWWRRPISRLYFAVVLEDGRPVTLYRDLRRDRWFLQGGGA